MGEDPNENSIKIKKKIEISTDTQSENIHTINLSSEKMHKSMSATRITKNDIPAAKENTSRIEGRQQVIDRIVSEGKDITIERVTTERMTENKQQDALPKGSSPKWNPVSPEEVTRGISTKRITREHPKEVAEDNG